MTVVWLIPILWQKLFIRLDALFQFVAFSLRRSEQECPYFALSHGMSAYLWGHVIGHVG